MPIHVFKENEKIYIHPECRKIHTNIRRYEQMRKRNAESQPSAKKLRSEITRFSFHTDCYLCGKYVDKEKAKRFPKHAEYEFSRAMVINVKETVMGRCTERRAIKADEWAENVAHRLSCVVDLPAEEAVYHRRCFQYFMSPRYLDVLSLEGSPPSKRGRPSGSMDEDKQAAFLNVIE